jgi:hypothetical protein
MRIISIRVASVARIVAVVYAMIGLLVWLRFAFGSEQYLSFPLGLVAPLFNLNLNFHLERSSSVFYGLVMCIASVLSYSVTGWLTGAGAALCFNLVAKRIGGIDAKNFVVTDAAHENRHPIDIVMSKDSEARS